MARSPIQCDLCSKDIDDERWVGLARWVVNTKDGFIMYQRDPVWDPDGGEASMLTLCFPGCLHSWLESEMVEVDSSNKKRRWRR